ncbi:MAG: MFS transporter [Candidatus Bathyarchaeota archaeon]|jgi:MFS family permease
MLSTLRKPALFRIYLIPFITMLVSSMVWSISIVYALELGANIYQVNLLRSIRTLMGIILLVPIGMFSDRFGRKAMVIYSRLITLFGVLIRAFASNVNHLYIASIVGGVADRGFFPVLLSMIGDVAEEDEKQEAVSILYLFSSIGLTIGPSITSVLLAGETVTLRGVYKIGVIAQILVLIYLFTQTKETGIQAQNAEKIDISNIKDLLTQPRFRYLSYMAVLYFFSRSILQTYIPLYAKLDLGFSDGRVALLSTYRNLGILIIRLLSATLLTRVPFNLFLYTSLALGGVAGLTSIFANNYYTLIIALMIAGVSYGAVRILGATDIARLSTKENRGVANSLYNVAISSGNIIRTVTAPLAELFGIIPLFLLATITAMASIIPVTKMKEQSN